MAADEPSRDENLSPLYFVKCSSAGRALAMTTPASNHFGHSANLIADNMPSDYNVKFQLPEYSTQFHGPHMPNSLCMSGLPLPSAQPCGMPAMPVIDANQSNVSTQFPSFDAPNGFLMPDLNMTTTSLGLINFMPHIKTLPQTSLVIPPLYSPLPSLHHPALPRRPRQPLEFDISETRYRPTVALHSYRAILGTSNEKVEGYITPSPYESRRFACAYDSCTEGFIGKLETVREHVRKHLGINKLFECVSCSMAFTTQRAAKRHQQTQMKKIACKVCGQTFARLDYCRKHQQRCETRRGLLPDLESLNIVGVEYV